MQNHTLYRKTKVQGSSGYGGVQGPCPPREYRVEIVGEGGGGLVYKLESIYFCKFMASHMTMCTHLKS